MAGRYRITEYLVCSNCFKRKEPDDFPLHKQNSTGRRNVCKKCFGEYQYQRFLQKELDKGSKCIDECFECERLFKRSFNTNKCKHCR